MEAMQAVPMPMDMPIKAEPDLPPAPSPLGTDSLPPVKGGAPVCYMRNAQRTVHLDLPGFGPVNAGLCRGFLRRYQRVKRGAPPPPRLPLDKEWSVTLSGHKKGSNPRIKLEDGRLWCLKLPESCALLEDAEGPAIFARPVRVNETHRLQKYKRQPIKDSIVFSLTNGADKCYLRPALQYKHFEFVFGLSTNHGTKVHWFVTEEYITLTREKSAAAKRKAAEAEAASSGRSAPDGAAAAPVTREDVLRSDVSFGQSLNSFGSIPVTDGCHTPQSFTELLQSQQVANSAPLFHQDPTLHLAASFLDDAVLHTQQQQQSQFQQRQAQPMFGGATDQLSFNDFGSFAQPQQQFQQAQFQSFGQDVFGDMDTQGFAFAQDDTFGAPQDPFGNASQAMFGSFAPNAFDSLPLSSQDLSLDYANLPELDTQLDMEF